MAHVIGLVSRPWSLRFFPHSSLGSQEIARGQVDLHASQMEVVFENTVDSSPSYGFHGFGRRINHNLVTSLF